MLPIGDDNPTRITPVVNYGIIITCFVVFIWQSMGGYSHFLFSLYDLGVVPSRILQGAGYYTFITSIFLHGGWSHLLGNMLFLWVFGDNIEDNIVSRSNSRLVGRFVYLGVYLLCGVAASIFWFITEIGAEYPAVGASGAIAGILGAYLIFYPNRRIKTIMTFGFFFRVINVRAYIMIGFWFLYQFLMALLPINTGVAFWAHVGGFAVGVVLAKFIMPRPRKFDTYYSPQLDDWR